MDGGLARDGGAGGEDFIIRGRGGFCHVQALSNVCVCGYVHAYVCCGFIILDHDLYLAVPSALECAHVYVCVFMSSFLITILDS